MSSTTPNRGYPYPELAVDPPNIPADIEALATQLDGDVQNVDERLIAVTDRPFALIDLGTPNITNNSIQKLNGADDLINSGGMWDAGNPDDVTIYDAGVYEIGVAVRFASQATAAGQRNVRIYKNGAEEFQFGQPASTNYNATNIIVAGIWKATYAYNDVINIYAYQNSGGTLALVSGSRFWVEKYAS